MKFLRNQWGKNREVAFNVEIATFAYCVFFFFFFFFSFKVNLVAATWDYSIANTR
jgi:hypothetical protein